MLLLLALTSSVTRRAIIAAPVSAAAAGQVSGSAAATQQSSAAPPPVALLRSVSEAARARTLGPMAMWPNPVLRHVAAPVDDFGPVEQFSQMLVDGMESTAIAATQYHVNAQIIALRGASSPLPGPLVLVNPRVLARSPEEQMRPWREVCLVLPPGLEVDLLRDSWVTVESADSAGRRSTRTLRGEPARAFQHEYDHLRGVLIVDHADLVDLPAEVQLIEAGEHGRRQRRAYQREIAYQSDSPPGGADAAADADAAPPPAPASAAAALTAALAAAARSAPAAAAALPAADPSDAFASGFGPALGLLFLGSGLLPSVRLANAAALTSLTAQSELLAQRTAAADAGGTVIGCSFWLGYPAPLYYEDVLDVAARLGEGCPALTPGRLLRRAEFETALAASRPRGAQLRGRDGSPLPSLTRGTGRGSQQPPSALAVDAAWTALSGGSSYVSPEEVARQLGRWRPEPAVFVLDEFERSLLAGRAGVASGYLILFGMQALALALFVVQPLWEAAVGAT